MHYLFYRYRFLYAYTSKIWLWGPDSYVLYTHMHMLSEPIGVAVNEYMHRFNSPMANVYIYIMYAMYTYNEYII